MTKINKMTMHGFKSFARKTELLFGDQFNCVLGPNGSGKSNVLDALCFVLGRTSAKSLRAEKSANLIYNGGKSKKPMKHGEVSIYFDNTNSTFKSDDKEIKISRVVKSNGQSVYKINDNKSTRQEIVDLLSQARINPDGYNIILQGDIVQLVEMSPVERRKIIEEIAGISVYEEKKDKALRELGRVEERLKEAEIILTERKTYLRELRKERDQALKYKDLSTKVNENKATYVYLRKTKRENEKADLDKNIAREKEALEKTNSEIAELKQKIDVKKQELDDMTKELEQRGEKDQVTLHRDIEQIKVDLATNKTRTENCKNEIARIRQRQDQLNSDLNENNSQIEKLNEEKEKIRQDASQKQADREKIEKQLGDFKKKKGIESASEVDKQIEELDKDVETKLREVQQLREKQQNLLREKDRIEYQIDGFDEKINKVLEVEKENKDQINDLKKNKQEFKKAVVELNEALAADSVFAQQVASARQKLFSSQEELAKLEARNESIQERAFSNMAVKKIVEQKDKIKGIYGTVSELGEVNSKYALALEAAAGSKMNHVVVEDDKVAADCIKYLKDKKLGVASFIPLNKIKGNTDASGDHSNTKGAHGLAVELIDYDKKFRKVFTHVFGNTLVVDNIDVARRIGVGKVKMATLEGDLAERSGVMRGGFRQTKKSGGFKEKEVTKDINEYKDVVANMTTALTKLEDDRKENEDKIVRLREFKANLEGDIIKSEKSLHLEEGDMDASKNQKEELKKELEKVDKDIDEVQMNITHVNTILADNKTRKQELRGKIGQLRNPTVLAELNAFEQKRQELRDAVVTLNSEIKNVDAQIDMVVAEKDRIENILKQHTKESDNFKEEIGKLDEMIKQNEASLKEKEKKEKEYYSKFKQMFNQRNKLQEDVQKHENKVEARREITRRIEIKMNSLSLEHAKVTAELAGLVQEFSEYEGVKILKNKDVDELKREIDRFERLKDTMGAVNMKALEIYDNIEKEYNALLEKKDKLNSEREDVMVMIQEIEDRKKDMFMETLKVVNTNFQTMFGSLNTKGQASLVLENPNQPFEEGLRIMVRLTGTKFMDIKSLSGGEKTMTALAFIFAIQEHEPATFYVMDEVDAALDKHNSEKLAKLVRSYCDKAQYVVISHNDAVITEADNLYGVSMDEHGVTAVTTLQL